MKNVTSIFTHVTSPYLPKKGDCIQPPLTYYIPEQQVSTTILITRTYQNSTSIRNTFPGFAVHSCIASKAPSGFAIFEISSSIGQFPSFI